MPPADGVRGLSSANGVATGLRPLPPSDTAGAGVVTMAGGLLDIATGVAVLGVLATSAAVGTALAPTLPTLPPTTRFFRLFSFSAVALVVLLLDMYTSFVQKNTLFNQPLCHDWAAQGCTPMLRGNYTPNTVIDFNSCQTLRPFCHNNNSTEYGSCTWIPFTLAFNMSLVLRLLVSLLWCFVGARDPSAHQYAAILDMQLKGALPWPETQGGGSYRKLSNAQIAALGQQFYSGVPTSQNATALALCVMHRRGRFYGLVLV